ncbi:MAG TPA: amidohydrolase family protein [Candidatus Acidoferrales bacterium]|nr:amidohydrolase family protein [Candidatus Acidoferrales bacterium]
MTDYRIVALEEHVSFRRFVAEIDAGAIAGRGFEPGRGAGSRADELDEVGDRRLRLMDDAGISVQVLSVVGPGADLLAPATGPEFARRYNDEVAAAVARHPDRFAAFAHLPLSAPQAAAEELERCVKLLGFRGALVSGTTHGLFLDDARFSPVLERAEALGVPLYIHPGIPPESVRRAYYDGFDPAVSYAFANAGWGWHAETAVHILRLVLSGALDRHPKLRVIIGHMGEGLPMMLARCDATFGRVAKHLKRSVSETLLDQVAITISGFFTEPPFMAALLAFGVDRILFSVDYPFSTNRAARDFLDSLPVSRNDKLKIAHANADRILHLGGE